MNTDLEKKHKSRKSKSLIAQNQVYTPNPNITDKLSNSTYRDLNASFLKQDSEKFKLNNRRYDFKIFDKQLEEIAILMTDKEDKSQTEDSKRSFLKQFILQYEACDKNGDNVLDLLEFKSCMQNDQYLSEIKPTPIKNAFYANYSSSDNYGFYDILFFNLDGHTNNFTNFHEYMYMRLLAFSWRKCSVIGPYIEEVDYECAIDIVSGYKTFPRKAARNLYMLTLDYANNESHRNLDFLSFMIVANSITLYSRVNKKEDFDISIDEFKLALDNNLLPMRYSQEVIDSIYKLVSDSDGINQGLDIVSFCFYDLALKLFDVPGAPRRFHMTVNDFANAVNNYLFPNVITNQIQYLPRINITAKSYQQYTYHNISQFESEKDNFLKSTLLQKKETIKDNIVTIIGNNSKFDFQADLMYSYLFGIIDADSDSWVNYYDFGNFFQIAYLYGKFDEYNKGRVLASDLVEKFTTYSNFPAISFQLRKRAKRFSLLPKDIYVDLMNALLIIKLDDLIEATVRSTDRDNIYEWELKRILSKANLKYTSDSLLNQCIKGFDEDKVPKYNWECAFIKVITETLRFYESSYAYLMIKNQNLTLVNTNFFNVDPSIA